MYLKQEGFESYALRLVPASGQIAEVELEPQSSVGIGEFAFAPGSRLLAEFGNGTLRLELYFSFADGLEPLQPPNGYAAVIVLNDEDSPD